MASSTDQRFEDFVEGIPRSLREDPKLAAHTTIRLAELMTTMLDVSGVELGVEALPELDGEHTRDFIKRHTLGSGGMGIVQLAHQRSLDRDVAIKRIRDDRVRDDTLLRLIHEARLTGGLEHPSIMPVYALGRDASGQPMMVMKRIVGTNWEQRLRTQRAQLDGPPDDIFITRHVQILIQICRAIEFAHDRGIVHRDLKPENVMLGDFGEVYVVDWGIAMKLADQPDLDPGEYPIVGTPNYMAPEMASGHRVDETVDVFLLGACLHEVLTGETRHGGPDPLRVMFAAAHTEPITYPDGTPDELSHIANRATSRAPGDRHPDVASFRTALEDYLTRRDALAVYLSADAALEDAWCLIDGGDTRHAVRARESLAAAHFGFTRALDSWPEHEASLSGLQRTLRARFILEVRAGYLEGAQELFAELEAPEPGDHEALDELRTLIEARAERVANLEALERDLDPLTSERQRTIAIGLGALGVVLIFALPLVLSTIDVIEFGHDALIIASVVAAASAFAVLALLRRRMAWTQLNRHVAAAAAGTPLLMLGVRVIAWWRGVTPMDVLYLESCAIFFWSSLCVFVFGLRLARTVTLFPLILAIGHALELFPHAYTAAGASTILLVALESRRIGALREGPEPTVLP